MSNIDNNSEELWIKTKSKKNNKKLSAPKTNSYDTGFTLDELDNMSKNKFSDDIYRSLTDDYIAGTDPEPLYPLDMSGFTKETIIEIRKELEYNSLFDLAIDIKCMLNGSSDLGKEDLIKYTKIIKYYLNKWYSTPENRSGFDKKFSDLTKSILELTVKEVEKTDWSKK